MTADVGLLAAFGAGVVSFVSPCVLPLVPAYLSFLGSAGPQGEGDAPAARRHLLVHALLFVAGFSVVFIVLGASASSLGILLAPWRSLLTRASGVLVFLFGFLLLGVVKVPWMYREVRFDPARSKGLGIWTAPVMGAAFGFGWTPCVGPILGSILALAAQGASVGRAVALLLAYSVGLGVPFVLAALALARITPALRFLSRHSVLVSRIAGVILMGLGIAIATGQLERLAALLT